MELRLKSNKIEHLNFDLSENDDQQFKFELDHSSIFYKENTNRFDVVFNIRVCTKEFEMIARFCSIFQTKSEISLEFQKSHFPIVNAPAIAFPFIRAIVSTITLQGGYTPLMLPSVNFVKFNEKNK